MCNLNIIYIIQIILLAWEGTVINKGTVEKKYAHFFVVKNFYSLFYTPLLFYYTHWDIFVKLQTTEVRVYYI